MNALTRPHPFPSTPLFAGMALVTAWLLSSLPALATGTPPDAAPVTEPNWGSMLMQLGGGLALFLFGMEQMSDGLKSAAGSKMKDILARFTTNRVKAAMTGGIVTAIIQSSSVTTVLIVGFVSAGLMSLTQSVGVIMGANVGTTITAQIIAFKVEKSALLMIAAGFAMLFVSKRDHIKQVGNISNTLLLLPFAPLIARLARRLAPDLPEKPLVTPKFLDRDAFKVPSLALQNARLETARLGEKVSIVMHALPRALLAESSEALNLIASADDVADTLEGEILRYLGELRKVDLTGEESQVFRHIMRSTDALETIADIITEEIVDLGRRRIATGLKPSDTMHDIVNNFHQLISTALDDTVRALRDDDPALATDVVARRHQIREISHLAYRHQESRFHTSDTDRLETFRLEMALVECLRRIYTHTKRIARTVEDEQ